MTTKMDGEARSSEARFAAYVEFGARVWSRGPGGPVKDCCTGLLTLGVATMAATNRLEDIAREKTPSPRDRRRRLGGALGDRALRRQPDQMTDREHQIGAVHRVEMRAPHAAVDDEAGEKILRLVDALEENDDVQNVTANFEISDALVAKMQG
jgi:hypothetical protein